ncbi:hypothetical protein BKA70DRAFT_1313966 [Coprinopsis sp. MPI-PUGE-AT-0042]|nr:hypothetical protein BKA70DRAFT_1313966 [Coprinopsis sp. MPI-PUGE-AT-0042]
MVYSLILFFVPSLSSYVPQLFIRSYLTCCTYYVCVLFTIPNRSIHTSLSTSFRRVQDPCPLVRARCYISLQTLVFQF